MARWAKDLRPGPVAAGPAVDPDAWTAGILGRKVEVAADSAEADSNRRRISKGGLSHARWRSNWTDGNGTDEWTWCRLLRRIPRTGLYESGSRTRLGIRARLGSRARLGQGLGPGALV